MADRHWISRSSDVLHAGAGNNDCDGLDRIGARSERIVEFAPAASPPSAQRVATTPDRASMSDADDDHRAEEQESLPRGDEQARELPASAPQDAQLRRLKINVL